MNAPDTFAAGFWLGVITCAAGVCLLAVLGLGSERVYRWLHAKLAPKQSPQSIWGFRHYEPERDGPCVLCGPEVPSYERWC